MSFQLPRVLLSQVARPAARVAGRNAGRRAMSSGAYKPKSDMPWLIGSTAIFGSAAVYLLSPPGKQKAHEAKEAALPKHKIPDPENAPVPTGNESETAPAEKSEATISDDEGNKAPASEVADSINKAVDEDSPKEAADAEAHPEKSEEKSEKKGETNYNPDTAAHADTEHKEDTGALETSKKRPRDVGGARERAKDGLDPSTSADVDEASGEADNKDEESKKEPSK